MALRKLDRQELAALRVGDPVAITYFDPHGPNSNWQTKMTTDFGVVSSIVGDPNDPISRTVWVRFSSGAELDYFGSQLQVEQGV